MAGSGLSLKSAGPADGLHSTSGTPQSGSEFIHEAGEPGVSRAAPFRQAADGTREGLQRLVVGAAVIIEKMVADIDRRAIAGIIRLEIIDIGLEHFVAVLR